MFAQEFVASLDNGGITFTQEQLQAVLHGLERFTADYDINKKPTELIPVDEIFPNEYKAYMVCKKIEGLSEGTLYMYKNHLEHFLMEVSKPLEDITTNDIRVYLYNAKATREKASDCYIDHMRLIINGFFQWLADEGYIERNVCASIKRIKFEQKERHPLTMEEVVALRDACDNDRDRALLEVMYSTGCRITELSNLKKSDINFDAKEVHLFGKGKKNRTSYLNATSIFYLKRYFKEREAHESEANPESVFVGFKRPYKVLRQSAIRLIIRKLGEKAGVQERVFPHRVRHSTATHALNRGMRLEELQSMLGHTRPETTLIYAKVLHSDTQRSHEKCII